MSSPEHTFSRNGLPSRIREHTTASRYEKRSGSGCLAETFRLSCQWTTSISPIMMDQSRLLDEEPVQTLSALLEGYR